MKQEFPFISVVLPVRNGARFIREALQSVVTQDYPRREIIVVDGHSTDGTVEIARSFAGVRILNQTGTGYYDGLNFGLDAAEADLIAFLEADDVWLPGKLRIQARHMTMRPELDYTLTRADLFLETGFKMPPGYRREWFEGPQTGSILSCLLARKTVFETAGKFDAKLARAGDIDWFARAKDAGLRMEFLPESLVRKRIHDRNLTIDSFINHGELLAVMKRSIERQRGT